VGHINSTAGGLGHTSAPFGSCCDGIFLLAVLLKEYIKSCHFHAPVTQLRQPRRSQRFPTRLIKLSMLGRTFGEAAGSLILRPIRPILEGLASIKW
jgi:hypothetical protein